MKIDELIAQGTEARATAVAKQAEQARQAEARAQLFKKLDQHVATIDQCFVLRQNWKKKDLAIMAILAITRRAAKGQMKAKHLHRLGFYACRAYAALHNNDLKKHITRFESEIQAAFQDLPQLESWLIDMIQKIQKRSLLPDHGAGVQKTLKRSIHQEPAKKGDRRRHGARRAASPPQNSGVMAAALSKAGVSGANDGASETVAQVA